MSRARERMDLVVLVPDLDIAGTVEGLLNRPETVGARPVSFSITRHLRRDSGCRSGAAERLREYIRDYRYTIVLFDKHGCGDPGERRESIRDDVELRLSRNGWRDRCRAIVIEPELEAWIWNRSREVPSILGWKGDYGSLRNWLTSKAAVVGGCSQACGSEASTEGCVEDDEEPTVRESVQTAGRDRDRASLCGSCLQRVQGDPQTVVPEPQRIAGRTSPRRSRRSFSGSRPGRPSPRSHSARSVTRGVVLRRAA